MPSGVYDRSHIDHSLRNPAQVWPELDLDEEVVPGLKRRDAVGFIAELVQLKHQWWHAHQSVLKRGVLRGEYVARAKAAAKAKSRS